MDELSVAQAIVNGADNIAHAIFFGLVVAAFVRGILK